MITTQVCMTVRILDFMPACHCPTPVNLYQRRKIDFISTICCLPTASTIVLGRILIIQVHGSGVIQVIIGQFSKLVNFT